MHPVYKIKPDTSGWEPVIAAAGALLAGPLLSALASLTGAFWTLGAAIMTTPIGWFLAGAAAIGAAAWTIHKNWGRVAEGIAGIWRGMKIAGLTVKEMFLSIAAAVVRSLARMTAALPKKIQQTLGLDGVSQAAKALDGLKRQAQLDIRELRLGAPAEPSRIRANKDTPAGGGKTEVRGGVTIRLENAPPGTRVTELTSGTPGFDIGLETGLLAGGGA